MNKSLKALENLVHCKSETKCKECKHKYRCTMERDYNTIKQDLERLEHLEKENKEKDEIIADLEQMYKTASNNYSKLNDKRKKLEKVIDLLDTALDLELENSEEWGKMTYFINSNGGSTLKKENYDLLKEFISEVLNNE